MMNCNSLTAQSKSSNWKTKVKNSESHPLNISWILPEIPYTIESENGIRSIFDKNSVYTGFITAHQDTPSKINSQTGALRSGITSAAKNHNDEVCIQNEEKDLTYNYGSYILRYQPEDHKLAMKRVPKFNSESGKPSEKRFSYVDIAPKNFEEKSAFFECHDCVETGLQDQVELVSSNEFPSPIRVDVNKSDTEGKHNVHRVMNMGNLALCSAPGKKIRLDAYSLNANSRTPVNRDLNMDFKRISDMGIKTIINLLDDEELEYLKAPINDYIKAASAHRVSIIRYPIIEGGCPTDLVDFHEKIIKKIQNEIENGRFILCHCRGGIGRAGLVACCWLLSVGICQEAKSAIQFVRMRRSPRAIETSAQEQFIAQYADFFGAIEQNIQ